MGQLQRRLKLHSLMAAQTASTVARPGDHRIADLKAWSIREPVSRRAWTVVRLRTDSGLTGWGECARVQPEAIVNAAGTVTGKPATGWAVTRTGTALDPAISMAMLDLSARVASVPLFRLLGGPTRFKVRALMTLSGASDADLTAAVKRHFAAGHRAFQVPVPQTVHRNQGQAFHHAVRKRMDNLRSEAPAGISFVLSGDGKLAPGDAAGVAAGLEGFHLLWFDEPAPLTNVSTLRKITDESVTPLGFGKTILHGSAFQDLLRDGLADILRPDLGTVGIPEIRAIAALAETYYVAVAPNHNGGPIATAAALQLAASLPNFFIQHVPVAEAEEDRKIRTAVVSQPHETPTDGYLPLSNSPGLGIAVNEDALERHKEMA
ncbi:MAG TPA: enolase C-terminal domain-like protein [Bryobacteraceae bacterium]|nr:enolase C-terminal domain-like protein [Bryobacteraceae bacterium]